MTGTDTAAVVEHVVIGGVDSHADTVHVAVVTDRGGQIADAEFPTTAAGYTAALAFLAAHGTVAEVGVEGTSSYGSGFTRAAREAGLTVVEVNRPDKAERRRIGKSDPIDAYAAARAVVSGRATSAPKGDAVAGIRALHNAARSAIKARTAALNQIGHILITAPDGIRAKYEVLRGDKRIEALLRLRAGNDPVHAPVLTALRTLARRVQNLTAEHTALTAELDALVTQINPGLRAAYGVGPDTATQLLITAGDNPARLRTEASFAALCGVAPVPASSGKTNRHRLSRGGDRAANGALYRIALVRMRRDQRTRDYVERQTKAGRTKKEIIRLLKRAIAREVFRLLTTAVEVPEIAGAHPPGQEHHAHRRSEPLRSLARRHLQHRTGTPPRRPFRRRLSQLARCRLTNDRSIKVMEGMAEWQNRPLDRVYPVLFVDAINVKIRDGQVANRPIYVVMAVTAEGTRDILGIWAGDGGEGAKYWLHVFTELKNRGLDDVLMLVCDGLKGLPEAVETVWPRTIVQTCVVHLLRNSFRYAARQDWDKVAKALKPVYTAPSEDAATERFLEFQEAWGRKYPAIVKLWSDAWAEFVPFLSFDVEIRKVICSTNAIESVNARIRKAVRARGHFPSETAALKCVYMALMSLDPTGKGRKRWTMRWKAPLNAFQIAFEGRLTPANN